MLQPVKRIFATASNNFVAAILISFKSVKFIQLDQKYFNKRAEFLHSY